MTSTAHHARASGAYRKISRESRAASADPVELVAMLYDELETGLGVLIAMLRRGQSISATEVAHRVRVILIALDAGLDHQHGGGLAGSLSQIYTSMRRRTDQAIAAGDIAALGQVLDGVKSLNSAWKQLRH